MIRQIFIGTVTALSLFAGTAKASSIDLPPQAMDELASFLCRATQKGYSRDYIYDQLHYRLKTYYQEDVTEYRVHENETLAILDDVSRSHEKEDRHEAINEIVDHANQNKCQF